jgi:hypothetical protein
MIRFGTPAGRWVLAATRLARRDHHRFGSGSARCAVTGAEVFVVDEHRAWLHRRDGFRTDVRLGERHVAKIFDEQRMRAAPLVSPRIFRDRAQFAQYGLLRLVGFASRLFLRRGLGLRVFVFEFGFAGFDRWRWNLRRDLRSPMAPEQFAQKLLGRRIV